MAVKGSKQPRMVVVPYRPLRKAMLWFLLAMAVAASIAASFYWGEYKGIAQGAEAVAERDELRVKVASLTEERDALRQEVANLKLGSEVDQQANEEVRNEVISLKEEIASLEEDISFYRGIMAPNESKRGLTLGSLNVISTGIPRQYEYKLVVQQLATNHQVLIGYLNFDIVGWRNGETETIPLHQLTDEEQSENIRLRFRYFQNIEGRLMLPEGFEPERIELVARSTSRNQTVEKKFGWLVQEI